MASQSDDVDGGKTSSGDDKIQMVSPDEDLEPIPFTDGSGNVIECYSDATATIRGVEYTIGHVCDNAMDIVFMDEQDELVPIEVEDDIMDEVFPIALTSLEQEFPGEFTLLRTPATLTLIGDLGGNDEEGDDDQKEEEDEDEATAELLLSFEHKDKTYSLVHPLDLMLLVGTVDTKSPDQRILISDEQAEQVMPTLMEMLGI